MTLPQGQSLYALRSQGRGQFPAQSPMSGPLVSEITASAAKGSSMGVV